MLRTTSNAFVEVHMIHPLGPSAVNCDEYGNPKRTVFGGYSRSMVSSQSQKRVFREDGRAKHSKVTNRTRHLARLVLEALKSRGVEHEGLSETVQRVCGSLFKSKEIKGSNNMITVTDAEVAGFADVIAKNMAVLQSDEEISESLKQELSDALCGPANPEVAMSGRWLAGHQRNQIFGALHVQPAIGVHAEPLQTDFWSAVDDVDTGLPGAGLVGDAAYSAPIYYRYSLVDVKQLARNLNGDAQQAHAVLDSTLESIITTFPAARARSLPPFTDSACVAFVVGINSMHMQMINAFRKPVNPGTDPSLNAVKRLESYWKKTAAMYEGYWWPQTFFASHYDLEGLSGTRFASIKRAKEAALACLARNE